MPSLQAGQGKRLNELQKQANNFIKAFFPRADIVLVANQIVTTFVLKFDVAAAIYPTHEALVDGVWVGSLHFRSA